MQLDPWGPALSLLFEDGSSDYVLRILLMTGLPMHLELTKEEAYSDRTRKRAYLARIGPLYAALNPDEKSKVLKNLVRELAQSNERTRQALITRLESVGWTLENGALTPSPTDGSVPDDNIPDTDAEGKDTGVDAHPPRAAFPAVQPSSVKRTHHFDILDANLQREEDIEALAVQMFEDAEANYYYFHRQDSPPNPLLQQMGAIYWENTEFNFYQRPGERSFVRINPREDDSYRWPWQAEYASTKPKFVRLTLKLAERKRRQLETREKLDLEDFYRNEKIRQTHSNDIFFSFSAADKEQAELVVDKLKSAGQRVFISCKDLAPGDDFAERIRLALQFSREVWLLLTPNSRKSEWVITEWGAAWAFQKRIVTILFRCNPSELPDRLKSLQWLDLHEVDQYIQRLILAEPEI